MFFDMSTLTARARDPDLVPAQAALRTLFILLDHTEAMAESGVNSGPSSWTSVDFVERMIMSAFQQAV